VKNLVFFFCVQIKWTKSLFIEKKKSWILVKKKI